MTDRPSKNELRSLLSDLGGQMRQLRLGHGAITELRAPLDHQPGGESRVFQVGTTKGLKAAKINFAQVSRNLAVPIVLQRYLGRFGFCPEVMGCLDGAEVEALFLALPAFAQMPSPWSHAPRSPLYSILVMDAVPGGWNVLQSDRSRPGSVPPRLLDTASLVRQVELIQNAVNELGIQIVDPQFLVSEVGEVRLIDLDHSYCVDEEGFYWGYFGKFPRAHPTWQPGGAVRNEFVPAFRGAIERIQNPY